MEEKILNILGEHCEAAMYYEGENMVADGIIDSFAVINIVNDLEETFDIYIDLEYIAASYFKNKESVIALVKKVMGEK